MADGDGYYGDVDGSDDELDLSFLDEQQTNARGTSGATYFYAPRNNAVGYFFTWCFGINFGRPVN